MSLTTQQQANDQNQQQFCNNHKAMTDICADLSSVRASHYSNTVQYMQNKLFLTEINKLL